MAIIKTKEAMGMEILQKEGFTKSVWTTTGTKNFPFTEERISLPHMFDNIEASPAFQQFVEMTKTYKQHMGEYLQNIHAVKLPGKLKDFSGDAQDLLDGLKFEGDGILSLLGDKNAEARFYPDLQGGCQDLQAQTGEILKPFIQQTGSWWNAVNIKITYFNTPNSLVQHNAVLVYLKGENPQNGYVFDPWQTQSADAPGPLSDWLNRFHYLSHHWIGIPNKIGGDESGVYKPLQN
jgi:hypothetical protein